jgi:4-hydroxybenzoate polyprenyltransferase
VSNWRDVVRIHRLEYPFPVRYLCHAVVGACYAVSDVYQLFTGPVLLSVTANFLTFVGGTALNSAVDISTDTHTEGKCDIAHAVFRLGRHQVMSWAATEMTVTLAIATTVALWLDRALIAAGVALAVALWLLYNCEPVRFKRRGFANPLAIALIFGPLPSLVSYSAVRPDLTASAWLIFIGLGALITGRALWSTVPDQIGDQATGMTTPTVRYGAWRVMVIVCSVTVVGMGLLGWGLWWRYGPLWALAGAALYGPFLLSKLVLLHRLPNCALPHPTQLRRRNLSSVMVADILLALLPLVVRGM